MRISKLVFRCLSTCLPIIILLGFAGNCLAQKKKILIVVTSVDYLPNKPDNHTWGCYTPEVSNFFARMYSEGYRAEDVDIVSLKGGAAPQAVKPMYAGKYSVPEEQKAALQAKLQATLRPSDVNANDYNVVYYAGGFSCIVDFPTSAPIAKIAAEIYERGGIVAAVCDGVSGLLPIKLSTGKYLVEGKVIAINSNDKKIKEELVAEGAVLAEDKLSVSQHIITAKGVRPIEIADQVLIALSKQ